MINRDATPTLQELQHMSYTSEPDGRTVHFRLMDRIKPRVTDLAIALSFPQYTIANLKTEHDPVYYLLSEWLRGGNQEQDQRPLTWGTLITALQHAGLIEEVRILEEHFIATVPPVAGRGAVAAGAGMRTGRTVQMDSPDPSAAAGTVRPSRSVAGQTPTWPLLIAIKKDDDSILRIKDSIVDFHDKDKCIQFAHLLLKSRQDVMKIENDPSKRDKTDLVRAVLGNWLSSGTSSWQQLIDVMRGADMDQATTDEIATYVL